MTSACLKTLSLKAPRNCTPKNGPKRRSASSRYWLEPCTCLPRCGGLRWGVKVPPFSSKDYPMLMREQFFIGGQWVAPAAKERIEVHHAGTGEVMGEVPAGTERDIDAAAAAA